MVNATPSGSTKANSRDRQWPLQRIVSDSTRAERDRMLAFAALAAIIGVLGPNVVSSLSAGAADLDLKQVPAEALAGFLFLASLYFAGNFLIGAWLDMARWNTRREEQWRHLKELQARQESHLSAASAALDRFKEPDRESAQLAASFSRITQELYAEADRLKAQEDFEGALAVVEQVEAELDRYATELTRIEWLLDQIEAAKDSAIERSKVARMVFEDEYEIALLAERSWTLQNLWFVGLPLLLALGANAMLLWRVIG